MKECLRFEEIVREARVSITRTSSLFGSDTGSIFVQFDTELLKQLSKKNSHQVVTEKVAKCECGMFVTKGTPDVSTPFDLPHSDWTHT